MAHRNPSRAGSVEKAATPPLTVTENRDDVASQVARLERSPSLPAGDEERFSGYGVMGLPFQSGDLLAMRRFPASSIGEGYTSVWHRDPAGVWTFWTNQPPLQACPRYFGSAITRAIEAPITVRWPAPGRMEIEIPSAEFRWTLELESTLSTRLMSQLGSMLPERLWRNPRALRLLGKAAGQMLHAGRLGLSGVVPNGQAFIANPRLVWSVRNSSASLAGRSLGSPAPLREQVHLGDFWLPQRGLFAIGGGFFEPADRSRHRLIAQIGG